MLAIFDTDVETHIDARLMNPGTHRGHDGYLEMVGAWNEAWGSIEVELVGVERARRAHMLTEIRQRAVGAGSGVPVEMTHLLAVRVPRRPRDPIPHVPGPGLGARASSE